MNRMERLSAQHDWSAVLLIVHERRANHPVLCVFTRALQKCEKICASHSYREADGKICDLF